LVEKIRAFKKKRERGSQTQKKSQRTWTISNQVSGEEMTKKTKSHAAEREGRAGLTRLQTETRAEK